MKIGTRMTYLWVFTASLLAGGPVLADTLDIRPGLRAGETYRWDYRREMEQQAKGRPDKSGASITAVTAKVLEASASGYVLEWRYGDTRVLDAAQAKALAQKDMQWIWDLARELRFELQLAPDGQFVQLRNYEQIQPKIDQMIEHILAMAARQKNAGPAEMKQVGDMMRGMFAGRERVEALMLKDVRLLLFPFGMSLDTQAPLTYQTPLANPFGGEALQAEGTISLTSLDRTHGIATIGLDQKLSPDSMAKILAAMARKMGENRPPPEELAKLKADITDTSRYTIDLKTGFPSKVEFKRAVFMPDGHRIDKVSFTSKGSGSSSVPGK